MSELADLEILESVVQAGARILRAEADRTGTTHEVLALTFDRGRIVIRSDDEGLTISRAADRGELPAELAVLDEEDPWWRLLGQPITAAWPGGVEDGVGARGLHSLMVLKMRFRAESDNPRVLCFEAAGRSVRVSLEEA